MDRNALGGIGGNSDICGLREIQDSIFADDFALDLVIVAVVDECLNIDADTGAGCQDRESVLYAFCSGTARRKLVKKPPGPVKK